MGDSALVEGGSRDVVGTPACDVSDRCDNVSFSSTGDHAHEVGSGWGDANSATLPHRVPPRRHADDRARGDGVPAMPRRGERPCLGDGGAQHPASLSRARTPVVEEWVSPWMRPPAWLYLPHGGATAGHETVDRAKMRRVDEDQLEGTQVDNSVAEDGGLIRGRVDLTVQPLGASQPAAAAASTCPLGERAIRGRAGSPGTARLDTDAADGLSMSAGGTWSAQPAAKAAAAGAPAGSAGGIRGQDRLPGQGSAGGGGRMQARVDAQLSSIAISIQDHAERVAAKRARHGDLPAGPTASARLEALRRRVAERVRPAAAHPPHGPDAGAGAGSDGLACTAIEGRCTSADCAHAATRDAQHAIAHGPGGSRRHLSI